MLRVHLSAATGGGEYNTYIHTADTSVQHKLKKKRNNVKNVMNKYAYCFTKAIDLRENQAIFLCYIIELTTF